MNEEKVISNQSVGDRLLELRNKRNMTQENLAEELQVSRQSISKWELNKTLPDVEKLVQLSELYQVSMDYLIKGVAMESASHNTEKASEVRGTERENESEEGIIPIYRYTTCLICAIISGILCICAFIFAGQLFSTKVSDVENMERQPVAVERIYEQYTKAEVVGISFDGEIYKDVVWLDIPGVSEGDYISCYNDGESKDITFEYYTKTLILPIIIGIVFLIFFIVFIVEWRTVKIGKQKKKKSDNKENLVNEEQ